MTLSEYIAKYRNTGIDYDKAYFFQCVDLFRGYCAEVLRISQPKGVTGAYQFWDNYTTDSALSNNFTRIANTADFTPQEGDVALWKKALNGSYGHVAICRSGSTTSVLKTYDQNWNGKAEPKITDENHTYSNFYGVLRPKQLPTSSQGSGSTGTTERTDMAILEYLGVANETEAKTKLAEHLGEKDGKCDWGSGDGDRGGYLGSARREITSLQAKATTAAATIADLQAKLAAAPSTSADASTLPTSLQVGGKTYGLKSIKKDTQTTNLVGVYE